MRHPLVLDLELLICRGQELILRPDCYGSFTRVQCRLLPFRLNLCVVFCYLYSFIASFRFLLGFQILIDLYFLHYSFAVVVTTINDKVGAFGNQMWIIWCCVCGFEVWGLEAWGGMDVFTLILCCFIGSRLTARLFSDFVWLPHRRRCLTMNDQNLGSKEKCLRWLLVTNNIPALNCFQPVTHRPSPNRW